MIIEGLVTTRNADGGVNVAPMGPIVEGDFDRLRLRPFPGSITHANLLRTRCGVYHVVDDVLLLVQTALDLPHEPPALSPAVAIDGDVLRESCRWYEFVVERIDAGGERPVLDSRVVHRGRFRDSLGFNRARHAVIEATIAATRLHLLPPEEVQSELARCRTRVEKTGGPREREAADLVERYVRERLDAIARQAHDE